MAICTMAKRSIAQVAKQQLVDLWKDFRVNLRQINREVRLPDSNVIAILDKADDYATFDLGPIVLYLPEKASSRKNSKVYAVIGGQLKLGRDAGCNDSLRTQSYATKIGYFREREGCLKHIFGAHYDHDLTIAHPVFHAQISTQAELADVVFNKFSFINSLCEDGDKVVGMLGNVRVPTSQMDFFAVLLQVFSDHLVNESSPALAKEFYKKLYENCRSFSSYCDHAGLTESIENNCFRAPYWYEH